MNNKFKSIMFFLFILSGCAQQGIYRNDISECQVTQTNRCGTSSFQIYDEAGTQYTLATVEIDDQGQLQERKQLDLMLTKLKSEDAAIIVVFVHGWHHNAQGEIDDSPEDENIKSFRMQLAAINQEENKKTNPRKVFGVYVGWRGDSITLDGVNLVTFWDRKNTAEEVGRLGLTEILLRLEEFRDKKNSDDPQQMSRLIVVGHSFGGAALFSATEQIFADRFIKKHDIHGHFQKADTSHEGFGDLVVLINPAYEALLYAPLYEMAQSSDECKDNPEQKPKLAILTSEGDWATGDLFPLGRFFYTLPETHNSIKRNFCAGNRNYILDEGEADRHAIGHFEPFYTHTLNPIDEKALDENKSNVKNKLIYEQTSERWKQLKSETKFGNLLLKHLGKTNLHNPYYNIRVSKKIIEDHNDIFKPDIASFIKNLIVYSITDEDQSKGYKK